MLNKLRQTLPAVLPFYMAMAVVTGFAMLLHQQLGRAGGHLFLNRFHCVLADATMPFITWAGDGLTLVVVSLTLLAFKRRWGLQLGLAGSLIGVLIQLLKHQMFADMGRPLAVFQINELHLVENVTMLYRHSFPSGHAATAFCTAMLLFLISKKKAVTGPILFLSAALVAWSRVYLSQHFVEDVVTGAWIGALMAHLVHVAWETVVIGYEQRAH